MITVAKPEAMRHAEQSYPPGDGETLPDDRSSPDAIREQISRILENPIFAQSTRLIRFLRYVVEAVLADRSHALKEYVIGTEVYDRRPPYHPSQDSIVRTEARRLRAKLKEYYDSDGQDDPIFVYFRPGSYVPIFFTRESASLGGTADTPSQDTSPAENSDVSVIIALFENLSDDPLAKDYARAIVDELCHQLMAIPSCQVIKTERTPQFSNNVRCPAILGSESRHWLVLHGTVARNDRALSVTSQLTDHDGAQLWSQRFDLESDRKNILGLARQVTSALIQRSRLAEMMGPRRTRRDSWQWGPFDWSIRSCEALMDQDLAGNWAVVRSRLEFVQHSIRPNPYVQMGISSCLVEESMSGISDSARLLSRANEASSLAIELAPSLAEAHSCLGFVFALQGQVATAETLFDRAWSLGGHAAGHRQYGLLLIALGRRDDGLHHMEKAQAVDAFSSRQKTARSKALYYSRKYEQLVREHDGAPLFGPHPLESQIFTALAYAQIGRAEQSKALAQHVRREGVIRRHLLGAAAEIFARAGDIEFSKELVNQYGLLTADSPMSLYRKACLASAWEEWDLALSMLAASSEQGEPESLWLTVDPRFDHLRNHTVDWIERVHAKS